MGTIISTITTILPFPTNQRHQLRWRVDIFFSGVGCLESVSDSQSVSDQDPKPYTLNPKQNPRP